jgi:hypothetical protein
VFYGRASSAFDAEQIFARPGYNSTDELPTGIQLDGNQPYRVKTPKIIMAICPYQYH